jgi:vacuolar protein sorting-associated protein 52
MQTAAGAQLLPDMLSLKAKSISKAREFFTGQINALRKNKTNVQVIQQNSLLKYAKLYHFLQRDAAQLAEDIRTLYVDTMSRIVQNVFKNYYNQLLKLDIVVATKTDLLVVEESSIKSVFTQKIAFNRDKSSVATDTFSLGEIAKMLQKLEEEPILLHVALAESQKFTYDAIIRSVLKHLVDAVSSEFLFTLEFFRTATADIIDKIFGKAMSTLLESIENYLLGCYDAVGLLVFVKVQHSLRLIMQRRRIAVLDPFFERLSQVLWPRIKSILELNISSMKNATNRNLGPVELAPLYVTRRYAELTSSISILSGAIGAGASAGSGSGDGLHLAEELHRLRSELVALLQRMAHAHFMTSKDQHVFFINNFDQILTLFEERNVVNEDSREFENLLLAQRELFAEAEVRGAFPRLVSFVTQTEQMLNTLAGAESDGAEALEPPQLDMGIVETLVRDFSQAWRGGIKQINDDVLAYFSNFRNGMEILKQVLTQLLLYYTRFQDIIKKVWSGKAPPFTRDIVSTATIMMEIKKYNRVL